jgi:protein phosphatase
VTLTFRYGAVSDIGRTRKKNDDSAYAGAHFVMVADGMGGAAAGDVASAVAVHTMQRLDGPPPEDMLEALAGAVHRANERLAELIEEDAAVEGMGTTVTAVLFDGTRIGVAHLGDSRGYLWRDGELLRITHDHTWVQSLMDDGRITEDEAKVHSHRSLLLKVLDGRHDNEPDLTVYDVQPGDRILICSDGLSGFVDHDRIERVLSIGTAQSVAQELLQLALEAGSNDNVTVVVADVVDDTAPDAAEPITVGAAADNEGGGSYATTSTLTGVAVDPEELRYAPRAPRRFRWLTRTAALVLGLGLVAVAAVVSYTWSQQQYYVASSDGKVAIYQGVHLDLPGVTLYHVYETQDLLLSELPSFRRSQVLDEMAADDLDHAHSIVEKLQKFAVACADVDRSRARECSGATPAPGTTAPTSPSGSAASSGSAATSAATSKPPGPSPTPKPTRKTTSKPSPSTRSPAPEATS